MSYSAVLQHAPGVWHSSAMTPAHVSARAGRCSQCAAGAAVAAAAATGTVAPPPGLSASDLGVSDFDILTLTKDDGVSSFDKPSYSTVLVWDREQWQEGCVMSQDHQGASVQLLPKQRTMQWPPPQWFPWNVISTWPICEPTWDNGAASEPVAQMEVAGLDVEVWDMDQWKSGRIVSQDVAGAAIQIKPGDWPLPHLPEPKWFPWSATRAPAPRAARIPRRCARKMNVRA